MYILEIVQITKLAQRNIENPTPSWRCLFSDNFFAQTMNVYPNNAKKRMAIISYLGMLGFSLQFYFQSYRHYYILLIPFIVILIVIAIEYLLGKEGKKKYLLYTLFAISIALIGQMTIKSYKQIYSWQNRNELSKLASFLNENIPQESTLVLFRSHKENIMPQLYFLTNINPPDIKNTPIGFYKKEDYFRLFCQSDYILISEDDFQRIISEPSNTLKNVVLSKDTIEKYNSSVFLLK